MQKNDAVTIEITDLGVNGQGIGHMDGQAVFVSGALPSETVSAHIIAVKKRYAVAKLVEIITPSPARVKPKCPVFGVCGGCTLQHLSYAAQLEWKRKYTEDCLLRIGGIKIDVPFPLPSVHEYRYRNKAAFACENQNGYKAIGFYKHHTHHVVDIDDCRAQYEEVRFVMSQLRVWLAKYDVPVYDETTGRGLLRHVIIRSNNAGEMLMALVINGDEIPGQKHLLTLFKLALPKVKSIVLNKNKTHGNAIMGDTSIPIYGSGFFYETICGMDFKISAASFLQVNPQVTHTLYNDVFKKLDLKPTDTVLDLFCGAGTLTLMAAKRAKAAYGIEVVKDAVNDAQFNANLNDIKNARFYAGDAGELIKSAAADAGKIDAVIADPPRKGLDPELIRAITTIAPAKIAYVSCDAATLSRDLKQFTDGGYRVNAVQPADMFPMSSHIECAVLMSRA